MTARNLIVTLVATGLVALVLLVALAALAVQNAAQMAQRIGADDDRAAIIGALSTDVRRYSEEVASVLLLGDSEKDDLTNARVLLERDFARLDLATRNEIATLARVQDVASQLPQVDTTRRAIELYHAIDMATARAIVQQRNNRLADALQLYQNEVQFRLTNELAPLLDNELVGERKAIDLGRAALADLARNALLGGIAIAVVAGAAMLGLLFLLNRRTGQRDAEVLAALHSLADGAPDSRLPPAAGRFGTFTRAFNDMATAVLTRERALDESLTRLSTEMESQRHRWDETNATLLAADERRSHFLADVSHQLRTPLTILRGEADLALRGKRRIGELQQALERIETQAEEMGQLLADLIGYARSDAESHVHEPTEIHIEEVVGAAVEEGRALAEPREVTIVAAFPSETIVVDGDSRRLKQALLIGLDNAIKHSPPGGRIDVETARTGNGVAIRIVDDGPGIEPEEQPRLFERFFRGRAEQELLNQGLGIGLPIARQIVERHGGHIGLENQEGRGAVLEITLPAVAEAP